MLDLVTTTQFRKDLKKLRKRGADIQNQKKVLLHEAETLRATIPFLIELVP